MAAFGFRICAALLRTRIDPESGVEWINAGGHDNAVLAVFNGEADAAFTFKDARTLFEDEDNYADIQATCKFIVDTSIIPNDTISVIPNLTNKLKADVKAAFMAIAPSWVAPILLKVPFMLPSGVRAALTITASLIWHSLNFKWLIYGLRLHFLWQPLH